VATFDELLRGYAVPGVTEEPPKTRRTTPLPTAQPKKPARFDDLLASFSQGGGTSTVAVPEPITPSPAINIKPLADRLSTISNQMPGLPVAGPISGRPNSYAELSKGFVEGVLPFGTGRKLSGPVTNPSDKLDRDAGVMLGQLGRIAAISTLVSAAAPEVATGTLLARMAPYMKEAASGAIYGVSDTIPEGQLEDIVKAMSLNAIKDAAMFPAVMGGARAIGKAGLKLLRQQEIAALKSVVKFIRDNAKAGFPTTSEEIMTAEKNPIKRLFKYNALSRYAQIRLKQLARSEVGAEAKRLATELSQWMARAEQGPVARTVGAPAQAGLPADVAPASIQLPRVKEPQQVPVSKFASKPGVAMNETSTIFPRNFVHDKPRVDYWKAKIKAGKSIPPLKVVKEGNNLILRDGNHRLQAFRELGFKEVPVEFEGTIAKAKPQPIKTPPPKPGKFKTGQTTSDDYVRLANKGAGIIIRVAEASHPDMPARKGSLQSIRDFIDRGKGVRYKTIDGEVHAKLGTLPLPPKGGWGEYFPGELNLRFVRRGAVEEAYVPANKLDGFGIRRVDRVAPPIRLAKNAISNNERVLVRHPDGHTEEGIVTAQQNIGGKKQVTVGLDSGKISTFDSKDVRGINDPRRTVPTETPATPTAPPESGPRTIRPPRELTKEELTQIKQLRDEAHEIGAKPAMSLVFQIQEIKSLNPADPRLPELQSQLKELQRQMQLRIKAIARIEARRTGESGAVRIGGGLEGGLSTAPITSPEGVRPRQFPNKGDLNEQMFREDRRRAITEANVTFDLSGKTRGRMSLKEIEALAKKGTLTQSQLATLKVGTAFPAEKIREAVNLMEEGIDTVMDYINIAITNPTSDIAKANMVTALTTFVDMATSTRAVSAEAGRALRTMQMANAMRTRTLPQAQALLDSINTENFIKTMHEFKAAVEANNIDGALKIAGELTHKPWWEKAVDFSAATLLLSGHTWIRNTTGNSLALAWRMGEGPAVVTADWIRATITNTPRTVYFRELAAENFALLDAIPEAFSTFVTILQKAYKGEIVELGQISDMYGISNLKRYVTPLADVKGVFKPGSRLQSPDFWTNLMTSPLQATDALFKVLHFRMSVSGQAYRMAIREGLEGQGFVDRVYALTQEPTKAMVEEATAKTLEHTFQSSLGELGKLLNRARFVKGFGPLVRWELPFFRGPVNLLKYSGQRSPLALTPGSKSFERIMSKAPAFERAAGLLPGDIERSQSEAIGKVIMGSLVSLTAGVLAYRGIITGAGSTKPSYNKLMQALGWQPNAVRLGDYSVSMMGLEPLSMNVALPATIVETYTQLTAPGVKASWEDYQTILTNSLQFGLSSTFFRQFKELIDFSSGKNKDFFPNMMATRIVTPPPVQYVNRLFFDNIIRKPEGFMETFKARTPLMSQTVAPRIDAAGNQVQVTEGPRWLPQRITKYKDIPALREMVRLGVTVPEQDEPMTVKVAGSKQGIPVQLTQSERSIIDSVSNKRMVIVINDLVLKPAYRVLPDDVKRRLLKALVKQSDDEVRQEFGKNIISESQRR